MDAIVFVVGGRGAVASGDELWLVVVEFVVMFFDYFNELFVLFKMKC